MSNSIVWVVRVRIVFETVEVHVLQHVVHDAVLEQRQVAEHVLVGHLHTVRSLTADLLHGTLDVDQAGLFQAQNGDVQRDERTGSANAGCEDRGDQIRTKSKCLVSSSIT